MKLNGPKDRNLDNEHISGSGKSVLDFEKNKGE